MPWDRGCDFTHRNIADSAWRIITITLTRGASKQADCASVGMNQTPSGSDTLLPPKAMQQRQAEPRAKGTRARALAEAQRTQNPGPANAAPCSCSGLSPCDTKAALPPIFSLRPTSDE